MRIVLLLLILVCLGMEGIFIYKSQKFSLQRCQVELQKIVSRDGLEMSDKIKKWQKFESHCSWNGFYQDWLIKMLILNDQPLVAFGVLKELLDNNKFQTKERSLLLAKLLQVLGKISEANYIAKKLIGKHPDWYGGYQALGGEYICKKQWKLAKKQYDKSLELKPNDTSTLLCLSEVSYELGDYDNVIEYYKQAFIINPPHPFLSKNASAAAVIVCIKRKDFEHAKGILDNQKFYDKTVEDDPLYQQSVKLYETEFAKYQNETLK